MKQVLYLLFTAILLGSNLHAQNSLEFVLSEVEKNNTTLAALRKSLDADKIENRTGIFLQNPEFGFNYLWGDPSAIGNRTDISITQSIDFPTAYNHKKKISNIRNDQVELKYEKQLRDLLLKTRLLCFDLIYTNALLEELSKRLTHAERIATAYKSKFDIGETNILEYNKARLNYTNARKEFEILELEKANLLAALRVLNGNRPIPFSNTSYLPETIPADFEEWYIEAENNNPMLNWLKQELEINIKQEKLNRAMSLPKIQAGYMSEKIIGEQFQGLTVGLAIPLFENKNSVKVAKANTLAIESLRADSKLQFYNQLKALHIKATGLQKVVEGYRSELSDYDNTELLKKALDQGEITLIEYMVELSIYYESVNNLLDLEKELNVTLATLKQYL